MLTITSTRIIPEIDPQHAVDVFMSELPRILESSSVQTVLEQMQQHPLLVIRKGKGGGKPPTLPSHWHVELLPGDIHFFNDLPYAKYVYAPKKLRTGGWPVAKKVEDNNTSLVATQLGELWRQANVSALRVR